MATEAGVKYDQEKPMWNILPLDAIEKVVDVMTFGARKYTPGGWKTVPEAEERYFAALLRHLVEYKKGNIIDPDSGLTHMSHAACNAVFLLWFELNKEHQEQGIAGNPE